MKKLEAEKLVNDTFNQAYNEDRFRRFINELFHEYEKPEDKTYAGQYIWDAFKEGIVSYKRLCKFKDPEGMEVDVLAVKVPSRRTLENARTMQRNFIARYLNGSRGGKLKDAALVAFYSDDCDDWRFSLVRMDYVLDEEKQKVRKELTPARRFSFLVGKNEMTHTARRQLMPVLQSETETTLSELETAFNIETVTKEFFEKYKALYVSLKESLDQHITKDKRTHSEFESKSIKVEDFAKRLLGQIVFLYFLQKKGWLGVAKGQPWGLGPKDFLQRLYRKEIVAYENFFNDVLEHLFYDALATERHTQDHFFPALNCKIPFLNGGLFEPFKGYAWDDTDILLDNAIFKEIFDVFDLYNFTVREDEPLDKEVAVDPEMLGKVFENLIPENERKGSGTYYTPREIVHYMCQESLINYLDAKLNIESRPVVEKGQQSLIPDMSKTDLLTNYEDIYAPVVPREDIAEFIYHGDVAQEHDATAELKSQQPDYKGKYQHKVPESVRKHAQAIDDALASVKICDPAIGSGAFPVGVMNEIVRARGALNAYLGDEDRTPYDFKRHAIQESIYGVDIEPSAVDIAKLRLWLSLVVDEDDFGNIKPLPNLEYKIITGNSLVGVEKTLLNSDKFRELEEYKDQYFSETRPSEKLRLKNSISALIDSITESGQFDFEIFFSEVFRFHKGFDVVIGNPPYLKEAKNKETFDEIRSSKYRKYCVGKMDIWYAFACLAIDICNKQGVHSFIATNNWVTNQGAQILREKIVKETYMDCFIDFADAKVFDQASIQTMVYVISKAKLPFKNLLYVNFAGLNDKKLVLREVELLPNTSYKRQASLGYNNGYKSIYFESDYSATIKAKMVANNVRYLQKNEIGNGIDVLQDFVSKKHLEKAHISDAKVGDGIFVLTEQEIIALDLSDKERSYIRPYYTGTDIGRYAIKPNKNWILYADEYFRTHINEFPNLKKHIDKFSAVLTSVYKPYGLHRAREERFFEGDKILAIRKTRQPMFSFACGQTYVSRAFLVIQLLNWKESYHYVSAILNSRLIHYWLYKFGKKQGDQLQIDKEPLLALPIRKIDFSIPAEKLVHDNIVNLRLKISGEAKEVKVAESKLDDIIYKLYGLTPEEIAIVEEAVK